MPVLATWDIRSNKYALMKSSISVFSSLSTERARFSTRNLKYMRAFALSYPDETFVQEVLAHITWYHHITLLEKVKDEQERLWYIEQAIAQGWSRNVRFPRFGRVGEEKSGKLSEGGDHGQTPTKLYQRIQARGSPSCRNE